MKEEELKRRRTLCIVVILSGVTLDDFRPFGLHQEGFLGVGNMMFESSV